MQFRKLYVLSLHVFKHRYASSRVDRTHDLAVRQK